MTDYYMLWELEERFHLRELRAKLKRAYGRAEREVKRRSLGCLIGNTIAPGVEFRPIMHDPVFKIPDMT